MMDPMEMYPKGFHPALTSLSPSLRKIAKRRHRSQVPRVKYYFIDWGLSSMYNDPAQARMVEGYVTGDIDIPEILLFIWPFDPFPVDVFTVGNVFKKELLDVSTLGISLYFTLELSSEIY